MGDALPFVESSLIDANNMIILNYSHYPISSIIAEPNRHPSPNPGEITEGPNCTKKK
jgi:hypothetical protein